MYENSDNTKIADLESFDMDIAKRLRTVGRMMPMGDYLRTIIMLAAESLESRYKVLLPSNK